MSGVDKANLCDFLVGLGWVEVEDNMLVPPESLWQNKPKSFYVYDADAIQSYLSNETED